MSRVVKNCPPYASYLEGQGDSTIIFQTSEQRRLGGMEESGGKAKASQEDG